MARRPRKVEPVEVSEWLRGRVRRYRDDVVGEEPLEIRIHNRPVAVTMRTPGNDRELAAGFLYTEGLIHAAEEIASLRPAAQSPTEPAAGQRGLRAAGRQESRDGKLGSMLDEGHQGNIVRVELRRGVKVNLERLRRNFYATSSCGVCGKSSLEAVRVRRIERPNPALRIDPRGLRPLPGVLRSAQTLFGRTGGLHAAALFSPLGKLIVLREDVGRHNAVDKVIGWALLHGRLPLSRSILMVSGRGGFEIVQKACMAGLPVLASVSAPSSLAVRLARELNLTLIGFLRGERFVVYAGAERLGLAS